MPDDAETVQADERRAAVLRAVDALAESAERLPRQQIADARAERRRQLVVQQALDGLDQPLADLQRHVAGEAVADDHVDVAGVDVAALRRCRRTRSARTSAAGAPRASARCPCSLRSPTDSRPTRGDGQPSATRAYADPIIANWTRCCGRHSTVAPESSSTAGCWRVGMIVASAGRSTPGSRPNAPMRRHHRCAGVAGAEERVGVAAPAPLRRRGGSMRAASGAAPRPRAPPCSMRFRGVEDLDVERRRAGMARQLAFDGTRDAPTSSRPICR